jgi:hypothetical protein
MTKPKESDESGRTSSISPRKEKSGKKAQKVGSGPNATRNQKKKVKEARLRQLLLPFTGGSPTIAETTKAKVIVDLEEELRISTAKDKDANEKQLKAALLDLNKEVEKRTGKAASRPGSGDNHPIEINEEEGSEDDLVDSVADAFMTDSSEIRNRIKGKD